MVRLTIFDGRGLIPVLLSVQAAILGWRSILAMNSCNQKGILFYKRRSTEAALVPYPAEPAPATDEVRMTRLRVSLHFAAAASTFCVPLSAGSIKSF